MTLHQAIEYFENEIRFCERAPAGNIAHQTVDWVRVLDANRTALAALQEVEQLRKELEDERYRHDRYVDYACDRDRMIDRMKAEVEKCESSD